MRNQPNRMRKGIHVCVQLSLGFQNPSRVMRASAWSVTVGHWCTHRIKEVYMLDEEVWSYKTCMGGQRPIE